MTRIFDRDLEAARIAKKDAHGRSVDVHSLRHTFATVLARAGVSLQQAQALMRHFDPRLTAGAYTHLGIVDGASAVERLPAFPEVMNASEMSAAVKKCSGWRCKSAAPVGIIVYLWM